jgi:hypothetical protein
MDEGEVFDRIDGIIWKVGRAGRLHNLNQRFSTRINLNLCLDGLIYPSIFRPDKIGFVSQFWGMRRGESQRDSSIQPGVACKAGYAGSLVPQLFQP